MFSVSSCKNLVMSKKFLLSTLLFSVTFLFYTVPVQDWRYFGDDYGFVYEGWKLKSLSDVGKFFTTKPNNHCAGAPNDLGNTKRSFFSVNYRPLATISEALHYHMFGVNGAYKSYMLTIALFCLAVVLLFWGFSKFSPTWLAFVGATFFALHSSLGEWIGIMCMQTYLVSLAAVVGICLLLASSAFKYKFFNQLFAWIIFCLSLLMHEWLVVLPFWLLLAVPVFLRRVHRFGWLKESVRIVLPFFLILIGYFTIRIATYPVDLGPGYKIFSPSSFCFDLYTKLRYLDFLPTVMDFCGISWIASGARFVKLLWLLVIGGIWGFLFAKTRFRWAMVIFLIGGVMFCWPAIILRHAPGFNLIGSAFFIASLLVGSYGSTCAQFSVAALFLILSFFGVIHNVELLRSRSHSLVEADNAIKLFALSGVCSDRPVLLVGMPEGLITPWGVAQAIWLYRGSDRQPVYADCCMGVQFPPGEGIPRRNLVDISVCGDEVKLVSLDKDKAWFPGGKGVACVTGVRCPYEYEFVRHDLRTYDVSIKIDKRWFSERLAFVMWDFENKQFKTVC